MSARLYPDVGTSASASKDAETGLEEPLEASKLSSSAAKKATDLDKEAAKKEAKAEAKEEKEAKRIKVRRSSMILASVSQAIMQASKVLIKRIERNKRKYVTAIHGLEVFCEFDYVDVEYR